MQICDGAVVVVVVSCARGGVVARALASVAECGDGPRSRLSHRSAGCSVHTIQLALHCVVQTAALGAPAQHHHFDTDAVHSFRFVPPARAIRVRSVVLPVPFPIHMAQLAR